MAGDFVQSCVGGRLFAELSDDFADSVHVGIDLVAEFFDGGEGAYGSNFVDEVNGEVSAVEIAAETSEVAFDFEVLFAEGGVGADIDGGWEGAPVDGADSGVDTAGGDESEMSDEVGGGEPKGSSALGTGDDFAVESERVSEQFGGEVQLSGEQQFADAAGGDHGVALIEGGDFEEADGGLLAEFVQECGVAFAVVSEMEVGSFDDAAGVKAIEQDFGEELVGRHLQQFGSHGEYADTIDAGGCEESGAFLDAGEHRRDGIRPQQRQWMWVEGGDDGGCVKFGGELL